MYTPLKMLNIIDECEYETTIESIRQYSEGLAKDEPKRELMRNAFSCSLRSITALICIRCMYITCHKYASSSTFHHTHLEPVMRITAKASIKSVRVATVSQ